MTATSEFRGPPGRTTRAVASRRHARTRRSRNTRSARGSRARRRSGSGLPQLSAPQVGIASALGLATIAAPISGVMASPAAKATVNPIVGMSMAPAPLFPALKAADSTPGVSALHVVVDANSGNAVPRLLSAPGTILVTRASRSGERPVLPGCDGAVHRVASLSNGRLPSSILCTLWDPRFRLRSDAAVALAKLNIAYRQHFGTNICISGTYRTISEQVRLKGEKPGLAATPGTSEHGWGLAADLCNGPDRYGSAQQPSGSARQRRGSAGATRLGTARRQPARGSPWHVGVPRRGVIPHPEVAARPAAKNAATSPASARSPARRTAPNGAFQNPPSRGDHPSPSDQGPT